MVRRRGRPGLIGTVARTAVVAGTATATANAVNNRSQQKAAQQQASADQQAAAQQAPPVQPPPAPAPPAAAPPAPAPAAAAPAEDDLIARLKQLAGLRDGGVLSEEEFTAAKAKLLGI